MKQRYKRVILKVSGEGLGTSGGRGIESEEVKHLAGEILSAADTGCQVAVVVGGGNLVRGAQFRSMGISGATSDYMGMLATVINALALQDTIEKMGGQTRLMTAIPMDVVAEPFIRRRGIRHLEKGRIVILAGGTGNPHFTTDTAAALRATELAAQALLKATKVDGVYNDDPMKNSRAKKYYSLSYLEVLNSRLRVMDSTAITMCMENNVPIIVFNLKPKGNILRAIRKEKVGTIISA
jgi:uridylate kinase